MKTLVSRHDEDASEPAMNKIYWIDEETQEQWSMTLNGMQRQFFEQVLLAYMQCHIAMILMQVVICQELLGAGKVLCLPRSHHEFHEY